METVVGGQQQSARTAVVRSYAVVLVDEHDLTRSALRQALAKGGMHVVGEGRSPADVFDAVREHQPAELVIDPVFAGTVQLDSIAHIARLSPSTRVVVLTASPRHALLSEVIGAGARGYLLKSAT